MHIVRASRESWAARTAELFGIFILVAARLHGHARVLGARRLARRGFARDLRHAGRQKSRRSREGRAKSSLQKMKSRRNAGQPGAEPARAARDTRATRAEPTFQILGAAKSEETQ